MTRYLIDTDGVIDYLKGFQPTVEFVQRLVQRGDVPCTTDVVIGEVYAGVHPQDEAIADRLFGVLEYLATSQLPPNRQGGGGMPTRARVQRSS